jgi:hypothetical protein
MLTDGSWGRSNGLLTRERGPVGPPLDPPAVERLATPVFQTRSQRTDCGESLMCARRNDVRRLH